MTIMDAGKPIHRALVLASGSPRRKQLLKEMGIPFSVDVPDVEECNSTSHPDLSPAEIALKNAERKAQVVSYRHPEKYILAADTIVVCEGKVLGKPSNIEEAKKMLTLLSGQVHEVLTAAVWLLRSRKTARESVVRTRVKFHELDAARIEEYLSLVHVLDKAGAYAIQEHGHMIVERIEGSRTNVIGLPMEVVSEWWKQPE